jgi:hypothetical protein
MDESVTKRGGGVRRYLEGMMHNLEGVRRNYEEARICRINYDSKQIVVFITYSYWMR